LCRRRLTETFGEPTLYERVKTFELHQTCSRAKS
jgi:hypothetical protein